MSFENQLAFLQVGDLNIMKTLNETFSGFVLSEAVQAGHMKSEYLIRSFTEMLQLCLFSGQAFHTLGGALLGSTCIHSTNHPAVFEH